VSHGPAPASPGIAAWLLLPVAPALIALNILASRLAVGEVPPLALTFWRWVFAAAAMLPFVGVILWRERAAIRREWRDLLLLAAIGMGASTAFVYVGAETTLAVNIGLIYTLAPALIVLFAALIFGERLNALRIGGVLLAFAGVVAILCRGEIAVLLGLRFTVGDLWVVASAVAWAAYSLLLRHKKSALPLMTRLTAFALGGALVMLPFVVGEHTTGRPMAWSWKAAALIAFTAVPAGMLAYYVYGLAIARLGAGRAGVILYLNPVFASLYAWLFLDERLRWFHWLGAAMVLTGVFLATRPAAPKPK
jgi:drug/metabolite transporter (DMT)-like permease